MKLSIIRYMNCGKKLWTEPLSLDIKKPIYKDEMYFSFFELNNEKVIYVCFTQNFIDEKPTTTEVDFQYAQDYYFLDDFYDWWRKQMNIDEDILGCPNKEEKQLVKNFFLRYIEKTKDIETEIVYL